MFEIKPLSDVLSLLNAGASFTFDAQIKPHSDVVKMAQAVANGGGTLTLKGLGIKPLSDLIAIAKAGKGNVHFIE